MQNACSDHPLQVKLLARDTCQFCANLNRYTRIIHWQMGVRCCPQCFKSQTCTVHWCACHINRMPTRFAACSSRSMIMHDAIETWHALRSSVCKQGFRWCMWTACRAQHHCQLPAELVASLPSEGVYDRYAPNRETFRVLKKDLCPLLQQARIVLCIPVTSLQRLAFIGLTFVILQMVSSSRFIMSTHANLLLL
jgi:hypothetical protein